MPVHQDISRWSDQLRADAIQSILVQNVLSYDGVQVSMPDDVQSRLRTASHFWLIFSTGVEKLVKAVLLKHNLLTLQRRKPRDDIDQITDPHVAKVYKAAFGTAHVTSAFNTPLQNEIDRLHIRYLYEINTWTLGQLARQRGVTLLVNKGLISVTEGRQMTERLECLAFVRRNVESHLSLSMTILGQIDRDLEVVYLPLVNSLLRL